MEVRDGTQAWIGDAAAGPVEAIDRLPPMRRPGGLGGSLAHGLGD